MMKFSRALYGVDVILEDLEEGKVQPKIMEFNFGPDCERVTSIYSKFYSDVVPLMFAEELPHGDYFIKL